MKKRPGLRKAAYDMARQGWKPPMDWDKQQTVQNARRLDYLERSQKLLHFVRKFNYFFSQYWKNCHLHAKVYSE